MKVIIRVNGTAGKNTGTIMNCVTVAISGNADDFKVIDMIKNQMIVNGYAGKFMATSEKVR